MNLTPVCVIAIIFAAIYKIIELFVHRRERLEFINKMSELPPEKFDFSQLSILGSKESGKSFTALKIGALATGIGIGLFLSMLCSVYIRVPHTAWAWDAETYFAGGLVLFFGGIGLLIAFCIENSMRKKENKDK